MLLITGAAVYVAAAGGATLEFSMQPRLCVLAEGENVCRDTLDIAWRSGHKRNICLFRDDSEPPLHCWGPASAGTHRIQVEVSKDVTFYLVEIPGSRVVTSKTFEVVHENSEFRHRKRNPWSFF